jgi:proline-specific peptidase
MKKLIYGLIIALLTFTTFLFIPISQPPVHSGSYGIGIQAFHWIDENRKEIYSEDASRPNRELMVYVYYPTLKNKKPVLTAQDPNVLSSFISFLSKSTGLPSFLFAGLRFFKTHSLPNAEIIKDDKKLPVVVFCPGDPVLPRQYSWILEEVASHGFVVAAINQAYLTTETHFPDGRVVTWIGPKIKKERRKLSGQKLVDRHIEWLREKVEIGSQDVLFVAEKIRALADKKSGIWEMADTNNIGVMGHSYGGCVAVQAYQRDDRISCGINLDGTIRSKESQRPFTRPFAFIIGEDGFHWNSEHPKYVFRRSGAVIDAIRREKLDPREVKAERYEKEENMRIVTLSGVGHTTFIDTPLLLNSTLMTRLLSRYFDFALEVPAGKASYALVNKIAPSVVDFFEKYLKGKSSKRETIFDRVVSIPEKIIYDVPYLPPHCDEIANLKKGFAEIKDGKLYYEEEGRGIPIVLINGGPGGTHHGFHPYFSQIKDKARIIYYDQRGTGKSSKDDTGKLYTVKQAVEDLERLRKHLKIEKWALLGWSYGGTLAQCYALTYSNRCLGLILVASATGIPSHAAPGKEKEFISQAELDAMKKIEKMYYEEGKLTFTQFLYNNNLSGFWKHYRYYRPTREEFIRAALYEWRPALGFEQLMRSDMNKIRLKGKFDDFEIPTLIIEAKWELGWRETLEERVELLRKNHPHSQIEIFEKSGHMIFADEPEKFFALLRGFLKKTNKVKGARK